MSDEVGYRKPPKHAQFKKGTSGNPKGRPKTLDQHPMQLFEKVLSTPIVMHEKNGKTKTIMGLEAYYRTLMAGAMKGDKHSQKMLYDILSKTGAFNHPEQPPPPSSSLIHQQTIDAVARAESLFDKLNIPKIGAASTLANLPDKESESTP